MNMHEQASIGRSESPLDAAGAAAREIGQDAADSARQLRDTAVREASHVGSSARQWWANNRDDARQMVGQARQQAVALGESTQDYVRERPFKSLLAAAAVGAMVAAVALLTSRRSAH